jgi:excisionase family DNA binding protein
MLFGMRDTGSLITTAEAGGILDTVPDNVRRLAREGKLPIAATVGRGQRLFDKETVEQFAAARRAQRSPEAA